MQGVFHFLVDCSNIPMIQEDTGAMQAREWFGRRPHCQPESFWVPYGDMGRNVAREVTVIL